MDDGSGPARVDFVSTTGLHRPLVRRGETWTATGIVVEHTLGGDTTPNYRLQPRYASDVTQLTDYRGQPIAAATPTPAEGQSGQTLP